MTSTQQAKKRFLEFWKMPEVKLNDYHEGYVTLIYSGKNKGLEMELELLQDKYGFYVEKYTIENWLEENQDKKQNEAVEWFIEDLTVEPIGTEVKEISKSLQVA